MRTRAEVITDASVTGGAFCRALSDATDKWMRELYEQAITLVKERKQSSVALIAVGGYGRRELAPFSDLDLLLVHKGVRNIDDVASKLWYPIWDAGLKLGHAVRTPKETLSLCATDLDTATSLVTARFVAGDSSLADEVIRGARDAWKKRGKQWLLELHERVKERHESAGEVAFRLEPDLKEGSGGLRDVHALWWALSAGLQLASGDVTSLVEAHEVLLGVRVELHRLAGKAGDVLRLEDQATVAKAIGFSSDDALMASVSAAGRKIAWVADEAWARLDPPADAKAEPRSLSAGVLVREGEVHLADDVDPAVEVSAVLRVATAAAREGRRIARESLNRLGERTPQFPNPWPAGASDELVALLLEGERAIPVLEALDQRNLLVKVLPEWSSVRSKPQRNAYHRFTVDRHLWQACANAASLANRVKRPDLLVLGALFHDIGKGYKGDHTEVGVQLFDVVGRRMGLTEDDVHTIQTMIEHHLLLADVATHRDLSDDATITYVAERAGNVTTLELLHALTEADSLATGPSAWSAWKSDLVTSLAQRVSHVLGGGDVSDVTWRLFPSAEVLRLMSEGDISVTFGEGSVTVVSPDRPGTFATVAGVLSLNNLDVLGAEAYSDEGGDHQAPMAASEFRVAAPPFADFDWHKVRAEIVSSLNGDFPLEARLAERNKSARPRRVLAARTLDAPVVRLDNSVSSNATFVEVRAPDSVGILHRITKVLADSGLDIRHARVQTLGSEVVDTFYVRDSTGEKVSIERDGESIRAAVLNSFTN